jgi:MFS transporter, PAT family, beta-lactamase induction signal transducer AmpG
LREPDGDTSAGGRPNRLVQDLKSLLSVRFVLVAALFAVVVDAGDSLLFPMLFPLYSGQLHYSEQQIATLSTVGGAVAALASIAGGWLTDRFGRRRILVWGCLVVAAGDLLFALARPLWGSYGFLLGFSAASSIASGVVYAATLALFMDLTHPRLAATHFQISMALLNVRGVWGSRLGGRLAERLPATGMFGLAALVEILPLVLLAFLDPRKAKESLASPARTP